VRSLDLGRRASAVAARRAQAYPLIAVVAAAPRLAVLLEQRGVILPGFTLGEKSDDIARTYLASGTFGFIPGHPTAYTQPLYSYFLIPLYWAFGRTWEVVGGAQIIVAVATALLTFEIGRRWLQSGAGLVGALLVALHPYSLWHDVHINREILDGLLATAIVVGATYVIDRRSVVAGVGLGVVLGLAILSNVRLAVLPLVLAALLLWHKRPGRHTLAIAAAGLAAVAAVVAPWVIRNRVEVGCFALTTDSRALWEANNPATYELLRHGKWIDNVPLPPSFPPSAQDAGREYRRHGVIVNVDECAQVSFYQHKVFRFWSHDPHEKLLLAKQATVMLWDPRVSPPERSSEAPGGSLGSLRHWLEPAFMIPVFLLAVYGLFRVPRVFAAIVVTMLGYQWVLAMIFVGATRYRVPWDFLSALLAGAALVDLVGRVQARRPQVKA
jgi:4-amino-4-deoxy-L-arabinose transferase-like glycosyltransferase